LRHQNRGAAAPSATEFEQTRHYSCAANVLNSPRAIAMGVYVVRAFVQLRDLLASNKTLAQKLSEGHTPLTVS
jgi:hypothetical protein